MRRRYLHLRFSYAASTVKWAASASLQKLGLWRLVKPLGLAHHYLFPHGKEFLAAAEEIHRLRRSLPTDLDVAVDRCFHERLDQWKIGRCYVKPAVWAARSEIGIDPCEWMLELLSALRAGDLDAVCVLVQGNSFHG